MSRPSVLRKPFVASAPSLQRGRQSFREQKWGQTFSELLIADRESPLEARDLVLLSQSAMLIGKEREGAEFLARAHQGFLGQGETLPASRCAFWLGFTSLLQGDVAQGNGWLSRAERLLENQGECVERGYLLVPVGYRAVRAGEAVKAQEAFAKASEIGESFGDADLVALARQGQGRALIRQGEVARGVALLDEAMVAVMAGEVSPLTAGGVYCSVLDACGEIFDLRRAQEWTAALERWCSSQPDLLPYRGHCLVRRAEILALHGAWPDALEQAKQACERLSARAEVGAAFYRIAEIHRLRAEFFEAEEGYREAGRWQKGPQPGLALLRFAQGETEAADAAIRRVAAEAQEPGDRARVLDAFVEIVLASGDTPAARDAANELGAIAARFDAPLLHAMALRASGSVYIAECKAKEALSALRQSWSLWCEIDAPYEAARTRVLMAQACGKLDDCDAAKLELELACEVFQRLGAASDLDRAQAMELDGKTSIEGPLTVREREVLKLIAAGKSNRAIGVKLSISEKTVARHVSNIFNKLDLSSRAAATAYAYQHQLA
jgi:ATP/maltotriose-dependent transcriptional regulator MalT